jgi:hypothetical protein
MTVKPCIVAVRVSSIASRVLPAPLTPPISMQEPCPPRVARRSAAMIDVRTSSRPTYAGR